MVLHGSATDALSGDSSTLTRCLRTMRSRGRPHTGSCRSFLMTHLVSRSSFDSETLHVVPIGLVLPPMLTLHFTAHSVRQFSRSHMVSPPRRMINTLLPLTLPWRRRLKDLSPENSSSNTCHFCATSRRGSLEQRLSGCGQSGRRQGSISRTCP